MPQPPYLYASLGKTPAHSHSHSHSPLSTPTGSAPSMGFALPMLSPNASILSPDRDEMLCRYPSKLCDNQRSEKRGGGLHRFCAYHRERANVNQRRVDHRRRLRRQGKPVPPLDRSPRVSNDSSAFYYPGSDSDVKTEDDEDLPLEWSNTISFNQPLLPEFSASELQELMQLLDDVDVDVEADHYIKDEPTLV